MPLAGRQLTFGWALALCWDVGWRHERELKTAVAVMCAESARYPESWHDNIDPDTGEVISTDWGLFQLNDKAQNLELTYHLEPIANAQKAFAIYKGRGKKFTAWAAYNSGAYEKFMPAVRDAYDLGRWKNKIDLVVGHFG